MDEDAAIRLRQVITKLARQLNVSSTGEGLTPSRPRCSAWSSAAGR